MNSLKRLADTYLDLEERQTPPIKEAKLSEASRSTARIAQTRAETEASSSSSQVSAIKNVRVLKGKDVSQGKTHSIDLSVLGQKCYPLFMMCGGPPLLTEDSQEVIIQVEDLPIRFQNAEGISAALDYLTQGIDPVTPENALTFLDMGHCLGIEGLVQSAVRQLLTNPSLETLEKLAKTYRRRSLATPVIQWVVNYRINHPHLTSEQQAICDSIVKKLGPYCDALTLKIQAETSQEMIGDCLRACPTLKSLEISFNYKAEGYYFEEINLFLSCLHHPETPLFLKNLHIKGVDSRYGLDRGLGLETLQCVAHFLQQHAIKLDDLYLDTETDLWNTHEEQTIWDFETIEESLTRVLEQLKDQTEHFGLGVGLSTIGFSLDRLRLMRSLKLKDLHDITYDEVIRGEHSIEECRELSSGNLPLYTEICQELAQWENLDSVSFIPFDCVNPDLDFGEDGFYNITRIFWTEELFIPEDPTKPGYVLIQNFFAALATLNVKKLTLPYPHCRINSHLQKCLQEGLHNLEELTIVGCIDSQGSVEELLEILSHRPNLKYTLECGNRWSDETPYPTRVLIGPTSAAS